MNLFWILFGILFLSNHVEATTGFGSTILALTFGSLFFPMPTLFPLLILLNLLLSSIIVLRHPRYIAWQPLLTTIFPLAALAIPLGMAYFFFLHSHLLKTVFGGFVLLFSISELYKIFHPSESPLRLSKFARIFWLFAGGFMQGAYASGGPFVVAYASQKLPEKRVFRSTLSMLWLGLNLLIMLGLFWNEKLTPPILQMSLFLSPAVLLGVATGEWLHQSIPEKGFKTFVFSLLAMAGLSLMMKG